MKNFINIFPYAAGYIDGDGCIYIGKTTQKQKDIIVYEFCIQVTSVKKSVLDIFKSIFGGSVGKKPARENYKQAFCWTVKNKDAIAFANKILPYLVEKTNQCNIFIEYTNLITFNGFRTVDQLIINKRNELIDLMREDKHMNNLITKEVIDTLKEKKNTITPSESDYAYLAGLIDSEGCFRIKKWKPINKPNHVYAIVVEIGNTKISIMPWLIERFGGSAIYMAAKKNTRASAKWTLSAAALYEILPKIRQFLTIKQEVCDLLIEFQKTILPNGGDRHSELFHALFEKRREVRERIITDVHKFNLKGSH